MYLPIPSVLPNLYFMACCFLQLRKIIGFCDGVNQCIVAIIYSINCSEIQTRYYVNWYFLFCVVLLFKTTSCFISFIGCKVFQGKILSRTLDSCYCQSVLTILCHVFLYFCNVSCPRQVSCSSTSVFAFQLDEDDR